MLRARNTRDLSQAARAITKYLQELGFELPHAKALDMSARLVGKPNHMAAQAGLARSAGLPAPRRLTSYADLLDALGSLSSAQLAMSLTVTEGCDANGDAEFYPAYELLRAGDNSLLAASDGVLEKHQPVLLFNEATEPSNGLEAPCDDQVPGRHDEVTGQTMVLREGQEPPTHSELLAITEDGKYYVDVVVPVDVFNIANQGDIDWLNDEVSELITGSIAGLEDISYERFVPTTSADRAVMDETADKSILFIRVIAQYVGDGEDSGS